MALMLPKLLLESCNSFNSLAGGVSHADALAAILLPGSRICHAAVVIVKIEACDSGLC